MGTLVDTMSWTDEELVTRCVEGDTESFNALMQRWERPIYRLAYRLIGREDDARDVCQETFLRAFRGLKKFRSEAKFSSWLYRIAINLCRDWVRRERRTPVVAAPEDIDILDLAPADDTSESIQDLVERRELGGVVAKAMKALSKEQRTAVVLKEYHGFTFQEISNLLDCPVGTIKTRVYHGLSQLRGEFRRLGLSNPLVRVEAGLSQSRVNRLSVRES